jgi:deoxyribonuclease-4
MQIFSSSPRMWRASRIKAEDAERFAAARKKNDLDPLVVHGSYLINLAAGEGEVRTKSVAAFREELERCARIGARFLVAHPGNGKDLELNEALVNVARGVIEASAGLEVGGLMLLLECTAGQGATLGSRLEELAAIRELIAAHAALPVGYCLDTCHLLASGYDVASEGGLARVTGEIGVTLGWDRVEVIHANDSKGGLGSRLDRHEHIGEGQIGRAGFARILHDPIWRTKPFILETPLDEEGDDIRNIEALKALAA